MLSVRKRQPIQGFRRLEPASTRFCRRFGGREPEKQIGGPGPADFSSTQRYFRNATERYADATIRDRLLVRARLVGVVAAVGLRRGARGGGLRAQRALALAGLARERERIAGFRREGRR
jgi:hypothetical protein